MTTPKTSLIAKFADRFGVEPDKMMVTLKATAFKVKEGEVTNEQMMALLVVADQYGLNPWTREIFAFPDKQNGIVPVVGVDGWSRIINSNPQFDGMDYVASDEIVEMPDAKPCPTWIECRIYRKDRAHPTAIREYLDEVYRAPFEGSGSKGTYKIKGPWQTHTKRFLRHKATIQCARMAFGFVGIYDEDEAERVIEGEIVHEKSGKPVVAMPRAKSEQAEDRIMAEAIRRGEEMKVAAEVRQKEIDDAESRETEARRNAAEFFGEDVPQ